MKLCPYCAEEIQDAAIVCKHCGRDLGAIPPASPAPWEAEAHALIREGKPIHAIKRIREETGASLPEAKALADQWQSEESASQPTLPLAAPLFASPSPDPGPPLFKPGTPFRTRIMWAGVACVVLAAIFAGVGRIGWTFWLTWLGATMILNRGRALVAFGGGVLGMCVLLILFSPLYMSAAKRRDARTTAAAQKVAAENAAERIPVVEASLKASVAAKDWDAASLARDELKRLSPTHPALNSPELDAGIRQHAARRADEERARKITQGIEQARRVSADKSLCETPKAIADAWALLRQAKMAKRTDPYWAQAVAAAAQLEACRLRTERTLSRGMQQIMVAQREAWAQRAEKTMLDQGMDVEFRLSGGRKDQLTVKWVLMSKVAVHKLTNDGSMADGALLNQMQKIGFRRVHFSDGYDFGVYYDLNPTDETAGGQTVLTASGLGSPLRLQ